MLRISLAIFVAVVSLPLIVRAQAEVAQFDRTLEQLNRDQRLQINPALPVGERSYLDYGAYTSAEWFSLDDAKNDNHAFFQESMVGYGKLVIDGAHEFFFRGLLYHRDFNAGDRFSTDGEGLDGRVERAYYRFDLANAQSAYRGKQIDGDFSAKLGRDLVYWANGLTLNSEMDGAVLDLSKGNAAVQVIAGLTPRDTLDFDNSRPQFDHKNHRGFFGGMASVHVGEQKPFVYVLDQEDFNNSEIEASSTDSSVIPAHFHYTSHYFGAGMTGPLSDRLIYGVEGVYEGGHTLSSNYTITSSGQDAPVTQTKDPIEAYAFDARFDYSIPDEHATHLSLETILATGSSSRVASGTDTVGGASPASNDRAFNGFGLINVGVAFNPALSNLACVRLGASTFPYPESSFKALQLGTDLFWFGKLDADAPIDEPTNDKISLGVEPDLYLTWGLTSDVTLAARYGIFVPTDAIAGDHKVRQFFYTGLTFSF